MMVKHTLTGDAGELSPWLDGRTDLAKYNAGFQRLENFIVLPQGGVMKRPGLEGMGTLTSTATTGRLVSFQISSSDSAILAVGKLEMRIWVNAVLSTTLSIPWADADLPKLRWKQINDVMFFVHPLYPMYKLTRGISPAWSLAVVDYGLKPPLLKENVKNEWTLTTNFSITSAAPNWSSTTTYAVAAQVKYPSGSTTLWECQKAHSAKTPGDSVYYETADVYKVNPKPYWKLAFSDLSAGVGQTINVGSNQSTFQAAHVGSVWEIAAKRPADGYEAILKARSETNGIYSDILVIQGKWNFSTGGTWIGSFTLYRSKDRGETWEQVRVFTNDSDLGGRNVNVEGDEEKRVLMRFKWAHTSDGSSKPYGMLTATDGKIRGLVKITSVTDDQNAVATVISPVEKTTTSYWSEGAWSEVQGYPCCIETHQARLVVAGTKMRPHSVWGSAVDDYPNFYIGTDADMAYNHTIPVGERDPILWLISEKQLLIGTGSGEFSMAGESDDGAITPEFGTAKRQSSYGSHDGGASAIFSDSVALFIQRGGTRVRELGYQFDQDRYAASNLNTLADHLFDNQPIREAAVQRVPFQVIWFISNGKLYGVTYERQQNVVAWHRHSTQGEVISVATVRTAGPEDQVWLLVKRSGLLYVERFRPGALTTPQNIDAHWKDGTAALSYTAIYQPMTPEIPLANGSSRTREFRIHRIVPSLYNSRGGKYGQLPTGTLYPLAVGSSSALFTGEIEKGFPGTYSTNDGLCLVSDEPYPFSIRSVAIKFNVLGDAD